MSKTSSTKKIIIVCYANYCRSPVAEFLLKNKFNDKYDITSAGLNPIPKATMDLRSVKFLESKGFSNIFHNPKKITKKMFDDADQVYAMDIRVLHFLNTEFKNPAKIFLFNYQFKLVNITDPYRFDDHDYLKVMESISFVSDRFKIKL